MFVEWSWIVGLFIGAAIGSFLNVVIYRMPRGISLSKPAKSFCPKCKHPLGVLDLFPLLSYVLLGGKCRYCKAKVPIRYFFVEVLNGLIWAGLWYQHLILGWDPARGIAYALAGSTLVAVIFIDWELYIIPDQINAFLFFVGIVFNVYLAYVGDPRAFIGGVPSSLVGALVGVGVLWGIAFLGRIVFGKDAMGHGDIKMARGIGAVLLPGTALMSFGLAVVFGAVLGVAQILARGRIEDDVEPLVAEGGRNQETYVSAGAGSDYVSADSESAQGTQAANAEEDYEEPESIKSLLFCGLGYVLCIDIIGLFIPSLYMKWFGEDPFEPINETEDVDVTNTMIPFGPYLALGAIIAAVFERQLVGGLESYWKWATGGAAMLEHLNLGGRL